MATVQMPAWATMKALAPDFSTSSTYAVGAVVNYDNRVWKCTTAVETAGAWTGATNWTEVPLAEMLAELVSRQCEIVVTCVTQDDVTVTGQTVTLRAGSTADSPVYDTRAYNGQPVTFEVPRGFRYFVEVSATLSGHYAPTTATGTATTGIVAVTLTYSDINHITTFPALAAAVRAMTTQTEGRAALLGIEIADTWTDENGTAHSNPRIVMDFKPVLDASGEEHLAAITMPKYASVHDIQFDAPESGPEAYATEATAVGGLFYWGYGATYEAKTYAVNAWCSHNCGIFQCTTAVSAAEAFDPSKWSLKDAVFYSADKTYAVGDYARVGAIVYQCTTAVVTAEAFDQTKWSQVLSNPAFQTGGLVYVAHNAGQTINYAAYGAFYHTDVSSSDKNYFVYGYNNWELSAIRQYFGSDAAAGEWWHPAHIGDCPPIELGSVRGYQAGCSAALLAAAKPIRVPVWPWSQNPQYTIDKFWLPSGTEMFGVVNENEGLPLKGVQDACYEISGWTSANNNSTNARRYFRASSTISAATLWLRSATRGYSYSVWYVYTSGNINDHRTANNSHAGLPACAIY